MITTAESPALEDVRVIAYDILEMALPPQTVIVRAFQNESKPSTSAGAVAFYGVGGRKTIGKDSRFKTGADGVSWYSGHREYSLIVDIEGGEAHSLAGELENQLLSEGSTEFLSGKGMTIEKSRDTAFLNDSSVENSERGNLGFTIRCGVVYSMATEFIEEANIDYEYSS